MKAAILLRLSKLLMDAGDAIFATSKTVALWCYTTGEKVFLEAVKGKGIK